MSSWALKDQLESRLLRSVYALMRLLPLRVASMLGAGVALLGGPWTSAHRTALANLRAAFPEKNERDIRRIARGMWRNLGSTAAEFPHMSEFNANNRLEVTGVEHVRMIHAVGKSLVFFSGHFANWEMLPFGVAREIGPLALVYRFANNSFAEDVIQHVRSSYQSRAIPKGRRGGKLFLDAVRKGENIGMLIDQKMNEGIPVPFFGRDAMTAPAPAHAALKYGCPLIPVRVVRLPGCRFRVDIHPPLEVKADDTPETIMLRVHQVLEGWIRERPEQWFWAHNRWPKEK